MDIVLIAGLWLDHHAWDPVIEALESSHPDVKAEAVELPGQGDGNRNARLGDQIEAVNTAITRHDAPVFVVGHSAASTLAWLANDHLPDAVGRVGLLGGQPTTHNTEYADFFPCSAHGMEFPGWEHFSGPDSEDLSEDQKKTFAHEAIPVPIGVSKGLVHYTSEHRFLTPTSVICPEYSPAQARRWVYEGKMPEVAATSYVDYVDLDSGHWPMLSAPEALAKILGDIASA